MEHVDKRPAPNQGQYGRDSRGVAWRRRRKILPSEHSIGSVNGANFGVRLAWGSQSISIGTAAGWTDSLANPLRPLHACGDAAARRPYRLVFER